MQSVENDSIAGGGGFKLNGFDLFAVKVVDHGIAGKGKGDKQSIGRFFHVGDFKIAVKQLNIAVDRNDGIQCTAVSSGVIRNSRP